MRLKTKLNLYNLDHYKLAEIYRKVQNFDEIIGAYFFEHVSSQMKFLYEKKSYTTCLYFFHSHSNAGRFSRYPKYGSRPITGRSCTLIESMEVICRERSNSYCTRWFSTRWLNPDCRFTPRTSFPPLWIHLGRILKTSSSPALAPVHCLVEGRFLRMRTFIDFFFLFYSLVLLEIKNFSSASAS